MQLNNHNQMILTDVDDSNFEAKKEEEDIERYRDELP